MLGVSGIEPGDALSLATRFALQYAYRGGQALFWNQRFDARLIEDLYLPAGSALQIERRGFLLVEGVLRARPCTIAVTQFDAQRNRRVAELRYARTRLRAAGSYAFLFAAMPPGRIGITDLGFMALPAAQESIWMRGAQTEAVEAAAIIV